MNTSINTIARKFFSFASIAMMSAVGLGGCIANEEEMAAFENEMADESEEDVAEDSEALSSLPSKVYINNDFNSMGYQEGRYVIASTSNGDPCWIHEKAGAGSKSNYSIVAAGGSWRLFFNGTCTPSSMYETLGAKTTSDPLESPHVDVAPLAVNVSTSSLPTYASGDFKKAATNGLSSAGCWNRVDGGYSLASYYGDWYVFPGLNCATPSAVFRIGTANSDDPTDSGAAVITYKYYSAWPW